MKVRTLLAVGAMLAMAGQSATALAQDAAKGEKVFKKCKACHSLEAGKSKIGPSLAGIVGKSAASAEGFTKYSDALKSSGVVWDEASLDSFLSKPKDFIPGNKMKFAGLKKEDQRKDVIAYLKQAAQ